MPQKALDMYYCDAEPDCTCVVQMVEDCAKDCTLSCCGTPFKKVEAKTADEGQEKHVPVIEQVDGGYKVKVGDVEHPMEEKHFIQWIELRTEDGVYRKYLKPGMKPEAVFKVDAAGAVCAFEHCNIHGFWAKK